ncbi:sigma-70-like protein [Streptomyces sp. 1114.5]|uniref:sigma factor n=1 Tax=Streptomyces sp. 1114.5 TaxID=1938830 RepID=UPI000F295CCD|nr:sigma factor [Streptomyces sp. 1114.5]RKT08672.1 sigma-70-like protein [Streptomyces sp. 1114.5]
MAAGPAGAEAAAGYRPLLFSIAHKMTGSVGDTEDPVQDTFLNLTRAKWITRRPGANLPDPQERTATAIALDITDDALRALHRRPTPTSPPTSTRPRTPTCARSGSRHDGSDPQWEVARADFPLRGAGPPGAQAGPVRVKRHTHAQDAQAAQGNR